MEEIFTSFNKFFSVFPNSNAIDNGQSSEFHKINAYIPQGSLLDFTFFRLYINVLPKYIFKSFVIIDAEYTTGYRYTTKHSTWQVISSFTSPCRRNRYKMACNLQYFQNQTSNVSTSPSRP